MGVYKPTYHCGTHLVDVKPTGHQYQWVSGDHHGLEDRLVQFSRMTSVISFWNRLMSHTDCLDHVVQVEFQSPNLKLESKMITDFVCSVQRTLTKSYWSFGRWCWEMASQYNGSYKVKGMQFLFCRHTLQDEPPDISWYILYKLHKFS